MFGLSVFSLKGEHIGWFEDGAFFDVENKVLGFVPGAKGPALELPPLAPEPAIPVFSKRPIVPTLRGRSARPRGVGWSTHCLGSYLAFGALSSGRAPLMARMAGPGLASPCDQAR